MDYKLFLTLIDHKRIRNYLESIRFALRNDIFKYKLFFKGMISLPEGVTLFRLANSLSPRSVILEIGCYGGLSSAFLMAGRKGKNIKLYSIDPFRHNIYSQLKEVKHYRDKDYLSAELPIIKEKPSRKEVEKRLRKQYFKNFKLLEGYSFDYAKKWKKKINLLWIDGNHDFKSVEKDYFDWMPFLKKGGYIVLHDANKVGSSNNWKWGWEGPTAVVKKYLQSPKWININKVDSLVYATKNF